MSRRDSWKLAGGANHRFDADKNASPGSNGVGKQREMFGREGFFFN